ncbi:tRNA (adenosine(37)-N6)-dimethylallyltransferase MiaA [Brevibacterium album]|uniref:tRNA (adenosine(37)-N6)-dimethylallyltransferase MiaA n=1 Tax=Brevibacterium album TaxID=417948 RepID=UPI00040B0A8B|nr:tRNA (adenosine(37)-N6)-dimethylallyltransferase MiaA [Brevibacterium album]
MSAGGADRRPLITVVGATATGKSDLGIALARTLDGEIVNGDALQLYRGMDIGTAKLAPGDRGGVPHHLVDVLHVDEPASVSAFQRAARAAIAEIESRRRCALLVGGSGLYVRAVTDDMRFPGTDPEVRARLEAEAQAQGAQALHARLEQADPPAAAKIAPGDVRRIVRALEVMEITGEPFSAHLPEHAYVRPTVQLGLTLAREVLHARIADRVERMWDAGWVEEVAGLVERGLRADSTAGQAIGYAEVLAHLDGTMSRAEAVERTIVRTRQFAKRQETWFRRDRRITVLQADAPDLLEQALAAVRA